MNYAFAFIGVPQNSYTFQTTKLLIYEVKFTHTPYLFGEESPMAPHTYEFSIIVADNPTDSDPAFDERTSHTVAAIFSHFYDQKDELVTIYICDSSDGRQLTRQRKFNYWFHFFVKDDFVKYDDVIRDPNGDKYPVSLILKETNPYKAQIISEFIAIISGYSSDK